MCYRNAEGYSDPAAGEAIRRADRIWRPLVYICSPYGSAEKYCRFALDKDAIPLTPQLLQEILPEEEHLRFIGKVLIGHCEQVWVFGDENTLSMKAEIAKAQRKQILLQHSRKTNCKPILGDKVAYAGIPIDTASLRPINLNEEPEKVRFFVGIQRDRNVVKGVDRLLAALKRVHAEMPDMCEIHDVENLPYTRYINEMRSSHVLLDQLYSYTPATNALLAMAQGLVAVSGAEPEYYDLIGETENKPIINVTPLIEGDIDEKLRRLVVDKAQLPALSRESREFVVKHNDARLVAQRHLDFWDTL